MQAPPLAKDRTGPPSRPAGAGPARARPGPAQLRPARAAEARRAQRRPRPRSSPLAPTLPGELVDAALAHFLGGLELGVVRGRQVRAGTGPDLDLDPAAARLRVGEVGDPMGPQDWEKSSASTRAWACCAADGWPPVGRSSRQVRSAAWNCGDCGLIPSAEPNVMEPLELGSGKPAKPWAAAQRAYLSICV